MKRVVIICSVIVITNACTKHLDCDGRVFSKHGIPVPNVIVTFNEYNTASNYPSYYKECRTDANGYFMFSVKTKKKAYVDLRCSCDSGTAITSCGRPHDIYLK
jgi:hypothetical protein